jgi:hypothetical protein
LTKRSRRASGEDHHIVAQTGETARYIKTIALATTKNLEAPAGDRDR